jgi:hypothetical protein
MSAILVIVLLTLPLHVLGVMGLSDLRRIEQRLLDDRKKDDRR